MRRTMMLLTLMCALVVNAENMPLSQMLARLNAVQEEWTITFVEEELEGMMVEVTTPSQHVELEQGTLIKEEESVPDAVARLTKGLPVKVKTKERKIYVQRDRKKGRGLFMLYGYVYDNLTHNEVPGAVVEVMTKDSIVLARRTAMSYWQSGNRSGYSSYFSVDLPREGSRYILRLMYENYDTTYVDYTLSNLGKREFSRQLPPLYICRPIRHTMKEVTVTASKVMFYHRGDTVVYNADAFQLAEGSMLDALVSQLPGVELEAGGVIKVNGKRIDALLLNGKDFFRGDKRVMLENLPAYTVKRIEVYDKYGEKSEFLGQKLEGDKEYVMDVRLKKEYSIGWLVNAEGGGGSVLDGRKDIMKNEADGRYMSRAFAMRFTDHSRLAAFGNANNLNDGTRPGERNQWNASNNLTGQQTQQQGGMDYYVEDRSKKWKVQGNFIVSHEQEDRETVTDRTNFLPGSDTREHSRSVADNRRLAFSTWDNFSYNFKQVRQTLTARMGYVRNDKHSTFASSAWRLPSDTALNTTDSLIYTNRRQGKQQGRNLWINLSTSTLFKFRHSSDCVTLETDSRFEASDGERFNRQRVTGTSPLYADQYFKTHPDRHGKFWGQGTYAWKIRSNLTLESSLSYEHRETLKEQSLYLLDRLDRHDTLGFGVLPSVADYERTMDHFNSYDSRLSENYYTLTPVLWWFPKTTGGQWSIGQWMPVRLLDRRLHYRRDDLDTTLVHRTILFDTGNSYAVWRSEHHEGKATTQVFLAYRLSSEAPSLLNRVDIRDTSNPLVVQEGNADLRNTYTHSGNVGWQRDNPNKSWHYLSLDFRYTHNTVAMSQLYNTRTGVQTYKPYSVSGNWDTDAEYCFGGIPLDRKQHLRLTLAPHFQYIHSVDLTGITRLERSTVMTARLYPRVRLDYRIGQHSLRLETKPEVRWLHSPRADFQDFRVADCQTTLEVVLALPWKLQFSSDLTLWNRRGYTDSSMNDDQWIWKARLARPFCKGRFVVMLDGFDLLGQLKSINRTLNAQGRTETWQSTPPRYLLLHVQWKFNKNPKFNEKNR
ncbi:MAG: hypothetical protein IJV08_02990 [Bacteroidaceae bacterium]|nr:hypothetical protein [Bacteroidaceae bacterium]